jgi:hypothetical protein
MADGEGVWLVEREYTDKGLVTLVYATPDGDRQLRMQRSSNMLRTADVTAGMTVESDRLAPVTDDADRKRYAAEAERMQDRHDPDDAV